MTTIVGRGVKIEVALTYAASSAPTAISKAYPPVATQAAHSYVAGDVAYWTIAAGMVEMDQQAVYISNALTNTFDMTGLDTTNYSTYTAGTLIKGATWGTLSEAGSYNVGGGAAASLDDTRLIDVKTRNVAGLLASQDVSIDIKQGEISGTAMAWVERQALLGNKILVKISKGSQILRVLYGTPSLPGETVGAGQLGTGQFTINVPQFAIKPNV